MESFKSICSKKNLNEEYNLNNTDFKFIRNRMILNYTQREQIGFDGILKREKFILCDVYDNSTDAIINSYGYIYMENQYIMNVTKEAIYYIFWKEDKKDSKINHDDFDHYNAKLIGNSTKM